MTDTVKNQKPWTEGLYVMGMVDEKELKFGGGFVDMAHAEDALFETKCLYQHNNFWLVYWTTKGSYPIGKIKIFSIVVSP